MIRFIYNLLFPLGLIVFLPGYIVKMFRRGNYRHKFGQRFAIYDAATRERLRSGQRTWMHAVSVGEVAIALKLIAKIKAHDPAFRCVLSTTTTTGFAVANRSANEWLEVSYNPLDFWPVMRRAFDVIRPNELVLIEAEVWPNLVGIARARGIPVALVNARLSPRSERRFRRFRHFVASTFRCLDLVGVQEPQDIERWQALGIRRERIHHVGSIKYDIHDAARAASRPPLETTRPVLFGGSTHRGEEEILARVFVEIRSEFPELLLVIAPRHVERTNEIAAQLRQLGLEVTLRTDRDFAAARDCVLINTTGELQQWYAIATVVFIGKSLTAHGGQNPVEPIVAGKPVIVGPNMENFAALAETLVRTGGALRVRDARSLASAAAHLLREETARSALVANARAALAPHAGATERTALLLLGLQRARD